MNETENQIRLRRAKDALASYRADEAKARDQLSFAVESVKLAKARYEELFMAEEKAEASRRKACS